MGRSGPEPPLNKGALSKRAGRLGQLAMTAKCQRSARWTALTRPQ